MNSAPVEAISTTSLADEIAFRLQTAILDGVYPPGTHLFQDELCERFGVSRTPIREALRKLQAQHLVVHVPNKGATVRFPGREELIDVYDVRSELEGYACELAVGNVTAEMLATLDRAQADVDEALRRFASVDVGASDTASLDVQVSRANAAFHDAIALAAANECLRRLIVELQGFFPKDYVWRAVSSTDEVHALNVEEHERIRAALATGSRQLARNEMRSHIRHACRVLLDYLDRNQFWP